MKTIRNRLPLLLAGVFLSLTINAQTGVICGNVSDAKLNEPLIGCLLLSAEQQLGWLRFGWKFPYRKCYSGTYAVSVSYVSYQTQVIPSVKVVARQETVVNVKLSDADLQLQNVVVAAQRKLGLKWQCLIMVRNSLPVMNGISSQTVTQRPDSDAARC